jgi:peptidyl-tRNA hydrolase, PTH1 family
VKIIAGLGNPGSKYELTRHNIGFIISDFFAESLDIGFKAGKGEWLEAKGRIGDEDVYLLKPMTYMNNSGIAILDFMERTGAGIQDVLVIVDDFQIPLGMIRVRKDGSDGGHNGLSSIIYHLNSDEFPRMRIGIGKNEALKKEEFIDFVLSDFNKEEIENIKKLMPDYLKCIRSFIADGLTVTMNSFNRMFLN